MRRPVPPRSRRRAAAVLALAGVAGVGAGTFVDLGSVDAASSAGPTATAEARDLEATDSEAGSLARADTTTVVYDGTGGRVGGGPAGSGSVTAQSTDAATVARITPTQDCTADPAACEPTTTTEPPPDPVPDDTIPEDTVPEDTVPEDTVPEEPIPEEPLPDESLSDGRAPEGNAPEEEGDGPTSGSRTATLTELLAIGSSATRGSVLYRADDEPIVALLASTPLFRDLTVGIEGPDVQALEENLVALGYGSGIDVDEDFESATAAAVRAWEEDLGRAAPDGVVTVGEVVLLAEPTAVLGHEVAVGDLLESGDAVLVLGAESRVVETDVTAEDAADWPVGTAVTLDWGDGTTGTGTVTEVSRDVVDGEVALVVTIAEGGGGDRPIGSRVDVVRTVAARDGAVAVPVGAVVAGPDGPAVRVVGTRADRVSPVELGIVDDGWVEVASGLDEGAEVRLPG